MAERQGFGLPDSGQIQENQPLSYEMQCLCCFQAFSPCVYQYLSYTLDAGDSVKMVTLVTLSAVPHVH